MANKKQAPKFGGNPVILDDDVNLDTAIKTAERVLAKKEKEEEATRNRPAFKETTKEEWDEIKKKLEREWDIKEFTWREYINFLMSYQVAIRIAGWLFYHDLLTPKNVEQELTYYSEFAGQVRETVLVEEKLNSAFLLFEDEIVDTVEYDLKVRGSEWEYKKIAKEVIKRIKPLTKY